MHAPGHPGIPPTWTSSAKDMVGCALGLPRLWFTTGHGILNEVYYPRVDIPQIRDLGFIVADNQGFWVEVKRLGNYLTHQPGPGIPAVEVIHSHTRFELRLRIAPDPKRDALLIEIRLSGDEDLRVYALLAPHLGGSGKDNWAEAAQYRGRTILWAEQGPFGLALAAVNGRQRDAWGGVSAGYVGVSDGWQDFASHGAMTWHFDSAGPGNVALLGELHCQVTLALGFGTSKESAATLAFGALTQPFTAVWNQHVVAWRNWLQICQIPPDLPVMVQEQIATSAMVLQVHRDKSYPGAMVASLSIPWGNSKDDLGGYHLVWPRDLVESAGALLALGTLEEARDVLRYLIATQHADGHWAQNQWLGGKPYWRGVQLDETAFPVLLAAALAERDALDGIQVQDMIRRALGFIACYGPSSEQDRWEEDAGVNAFTLAVCIAALVCGAPFLEEPARAFALELADYWNAHVEDWTSVYDTALAQQLGVAGYYVRIAPPRVQNGWDDLKAILPIKNRGPDPGLPAEEQVSSDFLQLVRFGLRTADDVLIRATLKVIDSQLKVDTPNGPVWRRYTGDGYGEHPDGSPFDGVGQGRPWPLLTAERGHYELAAGRDPMPYLEAMVAMTGSGGLLPEQIWDGDSIPERGLYPYKPSGSAMPLVWAHAEFIKLVFSRELNRPFDRPQVVWNRYHGQRPAVTGIFWSMSFPIRVLNVGQQLRLCLPEAATVHWGVDGWQRSADAATHDTGLGLHVVDLPTENLSTGQRIDFTFYWIQAARWQDDDYQVAISAPVQPSTHLHYPSPQIAS